MVSFYAWKKHFYIYYLFFFEKMEKKSFLIATRDIFRRKTRKKHSFSSNPRLKTIGANFVKKMKKSEFSITKRREKNANFNVSWMFATPPPKCRFRFPDLIAKMETPLNQEFL